MGKKYSFFGRDIVSIDDFSIEELLFILNISNEKKHNQQKLSLTGKRVSTLFEEPSTRTRDSFESAIQKLGATVAPGIADPKVSSLSKGETLYDSIMMLNGYGIDAIVMRHSLDGAARFAADSLEIPILNAGDGKHEHPTQTMLDLFSINETQGKLSGLNVAMCGDLKYGRTVHSLAKALSLFPDNTLYFVAPQEFQMPQEYLKLLMDRGTKYNICTEISDVLDKVDIFYMTRIQKERITDETEQKRILGKYKLSTKWLGNVKQNMKILHPLPIDKTAKELSDDLRDDSHSYYYQQAANGLFVRMSLLDLVLGGIPTEKYKPKKIDEQKSYLIPVQEGTSIKKNPKPVILYKIAGNGVAIDHIPAGKAELVEKVLCLTQNTLVTIGKNVDSSRYGKKDIMKILDVDLSPDQIGRIALVAPDATITIIKDGNVQSKGKIMVPDTIVDLVECNNEGCISKPKYLEGARSIHHVISRKPLQLKCHYCDYVTNHNEVKLL